MRPRLALQSILALSLFGTLFSGALTYNELFGASALSCPAPGAPGTVFGYPACVYGFFMYLTILVLSSLGLRGLQQETQPKVTLGGGPPRPAQRS
jgi:hypothetical protein